MPKTRQREVQGSNPLREYFCFFFVSVVLGFLYAFLFGSSMFCLFFLLVFFFCV